MEGNEAKEAPCVSKSCLIRALRSDVAVATHEEERPHVRLQASSLSKPHHLPTILFTCTVLPTQPLSPAPKLFVVTFRIATCCSQGSPPSSQRTLLSRVCSTSSSPFPTWVGAGLLLPTRGKRDGHSIITSLWCVRAAASTAEAKVRDRPWAEKDDVL